MSRIGRILLLAAVVLLAASPAVGAVPAKKADGDLAAVWTTVFQTPSARNPFGTGGSAFTCIDLGGTIAPFGPSGVDSCTVKPGTKLFIIGQSFECSTFEGNGTTEAELRTCAREADAQVAPTITVDGVAAPVAEVETPLLHLVLPADNVFGAPAGTRGSSVAHGWVALLRPLTPGTHTIVINSTVTTTIVVRPGR